MKIPIEEKEIKNSEGCNYRVDIKKKNQKLTVKIEELRRKILGLQEQISENMELDRKLEAEGFCKIDHKKVISNVLTNVTMSVKFEHQPECIFRKESE